MLYSSTHLSFIGQEVLNSDSNKFLFKNIINACKAYLKQTLKEPIYF